VKPDTWMGRFAQWIAPTPPTLMPWVPPALSAAATAPPAAMTPVLAHNTPVAAGWQETAWAYYRQTGAARQGVEWLANGLSRCHLYVGLVATDGVADPMPVQVDKPVTEQDQQEDPDLPDQATVDLAREILSELHDGAVGQGEMLKRLAIHLLVPGESWLIAYARPPLLGDPATGMQNTVQAAGGEEAGTAWAVVSRNEWQPGENGSVRVKLPRHPQRGADGWVELPAESTVVIPVYQPDPEDALRATSRFESIVRDLDELDGLSRRVAADILSRLVGAGVFAVPESAVVVGGSPSMTALTGDPLISQIMGAASTAVKNPDSPSAHVPIILKISDEAIAKLQHLTFATPFDQQIPVLRDAARKAVAVGLDIPANVVLGVEDLNHWSAWSIDEQAIKSHLGPLASTICTTLTREVLWPVLRAAGHDRVERLAVWWNAEAITLRPDRSQTTLQAHQQRIIGGRAARRVLSFGEEDAPTPEELAAPAAMTQPPATPGEAPDQGDGGAGDGKAPDEGGQPTPGDQPNPPTQPTGQEPQKPPVPAPA
jgi:hypothetical protein